MTPAADHLAHGLYGLMIVDPPGGGRRPTRWRWSSPALTWMAMGEATSIGWNGVAGFFERYPIKVAAGELVRVYLLNMVGDDPVASFHLHAEMFDVYRSGTRLDPDERTDVVTLAQIGARDRRIPTTGPRAIHVPSAPRHMAERGAMGWFASV